MCVSCPTPCQAIRGARMRTRRPQYMRVSTKISNGAAKQPAQRKTAHAYHVFQTRTYGIHMLDDVRCPYVVSIKKNQLQGQMHYANGAKTHRVVKHRKIGNCRRRIANSRNTLGKTQLSTCMQEYQYLGPTSLLLVQVGDELRWRSLVRFTCMT